MILKLKEDPKEWRKITVLSAIALAVMSTVLCWRHVLATRPWLIVLAFLLIVMVSACLRPRLFRGYYRVSGRVGFALSVAVGYLLLILFFVFVLTPFGLIMRLSGKDLLRQKRSRIATTYWTQTGHPSPLDRLF